MDDYVWVNVQNLVSERVTTCFTVEQKMIPVTVGVGLGRSGTGIVGSNPTQDMHVCPRLSVLCCPV
jgi:hypothetical protein